MQIISNINNKELNSKAKLCKKGFFFSHLWNKKK